MSDLQTGTCTYCGDKGIVTRDHIPPKCLYPQPRPDNLVTVPSCEDCNNGAANDDEYFRLILATAAGDRAKEGVWEKIMASASRGRSRPIIQSVAGTVTPVTIYMPDGTPHVAGATFEMDVNRVARVTNRIVRGLFLTSCMIDNPNFPNSSSDTSEPQHSPLVLNPHFYR